MKIFKKLSPLLLLFVTQCSCSNTTKVTLDKPEVKVTKQYVKGTVAFDTTNGVDIPEPFVHPQLGDIFKKSGNKFTFDSPYSENQLPSISLNLYFGDINCDGCDELCYTHNTSGSSTGSTFQSVIYDYQNKEVLYMSKSSTKQGYDSFTVEDDTLVMNHVVNNYTGSGYKNKLLIDKKTKFEINTQKAMIVEETDVPFNLVDADIYLCKPSFNSSGKYAIIYDDTISLSSSSTYYLSVGYYYEGRFSLSKLNPEFFSPQKAQICYEEGPLEMCPFAEVIYSLNFNVTGKQDITLYVGGLTKQITFYVTE